MSNPIFFLPSDKLDAEFPSFRMDVFGSHEEPLFRLRTVETMLGARSKRSDNNDADIVWLKQPSDYRARAYFTYSGLIVFTTKCEPEIGKKFRRFAHALVKEVRAWESDRLKNDLRWAEYQVYITKLDQLIKMK